MTGTTRRPRPTRSTTTSSSRKCRAGLPAIQFADVDGVNVAGGSGENRFVLVGVTGGKSVVLEGGPKRDRFEVNPIGGDLDFIDGSLLALGGGDFDVMTVNDAGNVGSATYTLDNGLFWPELLRSGSNTIVGYLDLDGVVVDGGGGNADTATWKVESVPEGTSVNLEGGPARNVFYVSPSAENLDTIQGILVVYGNTRTDDSITVYDRANPFAATYGIQPGTIKRTNPAEVIVTHSNIERATLQGSNVSSTYEIQQTGVGRTVDLSGAPGTTPSTSARS